ncbi:type II toxin-antitoxin system RelB/DinJ family antitoxin [Bifidobacterium sp. ESL0728]|uniref:type II toxin-antitoxin system RelB/DinJ family antitoxin n=1 Tax=Bifidobacterium sp. ESL0728 TaxID=2983220 RepID=UPI0023F90E70|nr:type II toxin-antitoxin system RelB/DinJ family antitoxin [Bifidobacterium sp. ESL0728]WEV59602.1 type II toxin-antitoxin system RelB/DinJ family antitoxin [Bifidobacterium sp. ESL0728]
MSMVQMNVRIDADLKDEVDVILKRLGKTPSSVIRELWDFIQDSGDIPDLDTAREKEDQELEKRKKLEKIDNMSGIVPRTLNDMGLIGRGDDPFKSMSAKELHDYADEQRYEDYAQESVAV